RRSVLESNVGPLAVERCGVVHVPELVEQLLIRDLGRIVCDLDRLRVSGPSPADLLVRRVVDRAALVARNGLDHARHLVEEVLDPPETPAREYCLFHVSLQDSSRTS